MLKSKRPVSITGTSTKKKKYACWTVWIVHEMRSYSHHVGCTAYTPEFWCAEILLIVSNFLIEIIKAQTLITTWSPLVVRRPGHRKVKIKASGSY